MNGGIKYCTILCLALASPGFAQGRIDSLEKVLSTAKEDTNKANLLTALCFEYRNADPAKAVSYGEQALLLSEKKNFEKGIILATTYIGTACINLGKYTEALQHLNNALSRNEKTGDQKTAAFIYNNIGNVYFYQEYHPEALKNYHVALSIREKLLEQAKTRNNAAELLELKKSVAASYNNIGSLYSEQKNWDEALKNAFLSLRIKQEIDDKYGMAFSHNNIGLVYYRQLEEGKVSPDSVGIKLKQALANYEASLRIRQELADRPGLAFTYNNIGTIYDYQNKHEETLKNYLAALAIAKEVGNQALAGLIHTNIGGVYLKQKKFDLAKQHLLAGLNISKQVVSKESIRNSSRDLATVDSALGDFKQALEYHKLYMAYKDSLINEDNTRRIVQEQMQYTFDKKEAEAKADQAKKDAVAEEEKRRQQLFLWLVVSVGLAIALTASVIFRSLRITRNQKRIIDEKNRHITDSIIYAEHIQSAVLPSEEEAGRILPFETFIFYQPKDIVSGDFYWIASVTKSGSTRYIIAAADCTGHGVPGAFLSMIGTMLLNEIVNEKNVTDPPAILKELHENVMHVMHRENHANDFRDGMNIAICTIDPASKEITFAGAGHPLYIACHQNGESKLEVIKGDAVSIGDRIHHGDSPNLSFTGHKIALEKGIRLYMFSDGYMDQFQQGSKIRLGSARFKKVLTDSANLSGQEQKTELKKAFEDWKGSGKQIDDVLVMGIKI